MTEPTGMEERLSPLPKINSPLTKFIVALMKKSPAERKLSDPQKAAEGYGLPIKTTTFWINAARQNDEQWPLKTRR